MLEAYRRSCFGSVLVPATGGALPAVAAICHRPLDLLQPLLRLTSTLNLLLLRADEDARIPWQQVHIDVFRSLSKLKELHFSDWSAEQVQWLTADPAPTQLQDVGWIDRISADQAASLSRLPSLTRLIAYPSLTLADASFIGGLKQLQTVDLRCEPQVDVQRLMTALTQCSDINDLSLGHPSLTAGHLATLLPHLSRLSELRLVDCLELRSLSFLSATPHLASTLRKLNLWKSPLLPPAEALHVQRLHALEELSFERSFTAPLDEAILASFAPHDPLTRQQANPNLRTFSYRPPFRP